ncbi:MAG: hypothetical protein WEC73_03055 [Chthoniobacterales bacterium]
MSGVANVAGHAIPRPEGFDLPDGSLVRIGPCVDGAAESADFIRMTNAACTAEVCEETVRINES